MGLQTMHKISRGTDTVLIKVTYVTETPNYLTGNTETSG